MAPKTTVVFGATGAQGGSVVRSLLAKGDDKIRAVTRDAKAAKAQELKELSPRIELVEADANKPETLGAVFAGADRAFLLTNFWDPATMSNEVETGKAIAEAAKEAGVKQVVWSTLANVEQESKGKWSVPHFTGKAQVADHIRKLGFESYSWFAPSFYYQNVVPGGLLGPQKDEASGKLVFTFPDIGDNKIAMFDVSQSGDVVVEAFLHPEKHQDQYLAATGDLLSIHDLLSVFKKNEPDTEFGLNAVPLEQYEKFPFPGAKEIADMFGWFGEFGYHGKEDPWSGKAIAPELKKLEEFLQK
jgi:uncharacterized protein YbjT (DUF2867 family)